MYLKFHTRRSAIESLGGHFHVEPIWKYVVHLELVHTYQTASSICTRIAAAACLHYHFNSFLETLAEHVRYNKFDIGNEHNFRLTKTGSGKKIRDPMI